MMAVSRSLFRGPKLAVLTGISQWLTVNGRRKNLLFFILYSLRPRRLDSLWNQFARGCAWRQPKPISHFNSLLTQTRSALTTQEQRLSISLSRATLNLREFCSRGGSQSSCLDRAHAAGACRAGARSIQRKSAVAARISTGATIVRIRLETGTGLSAGAVDLAGAATTAGA